MKYYFENRSVKIIYASSMDVLPDIHNASAVVTDPPYELGFMGKSWDSKGVSFQKETWQIIRNSCKSGAMMLSFGGTRTFHRIAVAIEDAGWEFRDTIMFLHGQGFPKSLDISKQLDKMAGAEREVVGKGYGSSLKTQNIVNKEQGFRPNDYYSENDGSFDITKPSTPEAQLWSGYGTALKPAFEPILVCMNPLDGTFANNALKYGVAGINIDGCRVPYEGDVDPRTFGGSWKTDKAAQNVYEGGYAGVDQTVSPKGRFPANIIHDGSQMVLDLFPSTKTGNLRGDEYVKGHKGKQVYGQYNGFEFEGHTGDNGSAARFFYCAKASKSERNAGCEELEEKNASSMQGRRDAYDADWDTGNDVTSRFVTQKRNNHPTVKPLALMEYLCKLVKMPEYNLILDPFMGSGTTLLACIKLGIPCIGIDSDEHSCEIASKRCEYMIKEVGL